jgi:hypothetical protein
MSNYCISKNNLDDFKTTEFILSSLGLIFFRILLEVSFYFFILPNYTDTFFTDFKFVKYFESWIFYFILIMISPKKQSKPSDFLMIYFLHIFVAPMLVFYSFTNAARIPMYLMLFAFSTVMISRLGSRIKLPSLGNNNFFILSLTFFMLILSTVWMILAGGLNNFNLDLMAVYEYRDAASETIDRGVMAYLNNWSYNVFAPILMIFSLRKKKYWFVFFISCFYVFWFAISSSKSVLFTPLLLLLIWMSQRQAKPFFNFSVALITVLVSSILIFIFMGNLLPFSLIVRRQFFMPSVINFKYYEFFENNPFIFWSQSIANKIIDYPYGDISYTELIGIFMDQLGALPNANFLATGYMHAGFFGLLFYSISVGLILRLIDSLAYKKIDNKYAIFLTIVPLNILFSSADLLTTLLSHGLAATLIALLFINKLSNK